MNDDDWGMGEEQATKPEVETPKDISLPEPAKETKTEKEQEEDNPNDQSESWIVENSNIQPDKKPEETNPRRGRRGQEKIATVEAEVEELKPDKNDGSLWGEEANNAEKEKQEQERSNGRSGRGRGNRQGQEDNGGRGGRGFNRNYQGNKEEDGNNRGRGNREENGNQRGRGNRGDERPPRQNGFNNGRGEYRGNNGGDRGGQQGGRGNWQNRGDRNDGQRGRGRGRGRGGYNNDRNFHNQNYQNDQQTKTEQKVKKSEVPLPKGRKCWPQCSIYIFGAKLTITLRKVLDFHCKLLVTPFFTPKLQLYPGNIINQSKLSYKQKITKRQELKNPGQVYFQKAIGIGNFEGLAFLKVDDTQLEASFKKGIRKTFQALEVIEEIVFSSVVFCLNEELGNPLPIINEIILCLQATEKVKEFYLCTISRKCFLDSIDAFKETMQILFNENEVSTD